MTHKCDLCKEPARYKYKALWCCQAHYTERHDMFERFYARCKTPGKCGYNMLPSSCSKCGWAVKKEDETEPETLR